MAESGEHVALPNAFVAVAQDERFDRAFPDLYRSAYRVAYKLLGSPEDARDLAQEALARAYSRWPKVCTLNEPAAWVTRVTTNLAFDIFRRRRLQRRHELPADVAGPDADHLDLYQALKTLPKRQREVVVLRYLADQSEAATADALGCSPGAVKQHASRGLAALRARLSLPLDEN
jgi:RNA polymerase sigma-70 factor (sigma-E family)